MDRRSVLKLFGIGAVIAPVIRGVATARPAALPLLPHGIKQSTIDAANLYLDGTGSFERFDGGSIDFKTHPVRLLSHHERIDGYVQVGLLRFRKLEPDELMNYHDFWKQIGPAR